jgi:hypothetical protein
MDKAENVPESDLAALISAGVPTTKIMNYWAGFSQFPLDSHSCLSAEALTKYCESNQFDGLGAEEVKNCFHYLSKKPLIDFRTFVQGAEQLVELDTNMDKYFFVKEGLKVLALKSGAIETEDVVRLLKRFNADAENLNDENLDGLANYVNQLLDSNTSSVS